jgi:hypothetical protein
VLALGRDLTVWTGVAVVAAIAVLLYRAALRR